ncbi:sel1 repeat family protein [Paraburkholderia sp. D15]|uniref:SEL1-like repeat protein n=1 Tax=Paraburkholderia sp. D15 TaxID=2880218 RepID=UPI00247AEE17|nr:sel1 repeat family protein [Paraburkholderia sp. D15]WGS51348.1 sel1 repeat family protein [Paraburkholderia sp. D15]
MADRLIRGRQGRRRLAISLALLVCGCTQKDAATAQLPDLSAVRANLAFTCAHEADHLPPLDPNVDSVFQYARYLQKKDGPKDFDDILRYYRIAAANGHYKANENAQLLISRGLALSPDGAKEVVDLAAQLVAQGVPGGYYDIGYYLETGYGLKKDPEMSLRYFRKAADLGNPDAQYRIGELLAPVDKAPDIAKQMRECATDQGYGKAAKMLGIDLKTDGHYAEAIKAFQKGVAAGDSLSASFLESGFKDPPKTDQLDYLALPNDLERARRYNLIGKFLDRHESRNPKVPDIDKIVPLPPAKLPPWDGTFQWQKEQDAAVPPQKPSDELINELAKAKNLDPATGLPLAASSSKTSSEDQPATLASRVPIGTVATTGQMCPEDGVWCARLGKGQTGDSQRRFLKGDVLPSLVVHESRKLALLDKLMEPRQQMSKVEWELVGYLDHQA